MHHHALLGNLADTQLLLHCTADGKLIISPPLANCIADATFSALSWSVNILCSIPHSSLTSSPFCIAGGKSKNIQILSSCFTNS